MTNWKKTVSTLNAKHYSFPSGWDTRDTIAEQLECSPDRVDILLAPGLKSGEVEKQQFPVWDPRLNRKTLVWGYRSRPVNAPGPTAPAPAPNDIRAHVQRIAAGNPSLSPSEICDRLPRALRDHYRAADIRAILEG